MSKKIVIFGGSGYIGSNLIPQLLIKGYKVENYDIHNVNLKDEKLTFYKCNVLTSNPKIDFTNTAAVINLIGSPINVRWNQKNLNQIYKTRILSNKKISEAIKNSTKKPKCFISASGISVYKLNSKKNNEESIPSNRFIANLVKDWEKHVLESEIRNIVLRQATVIGKDSQFIKTLVKPFKYFTSITPGTGKQNLPFIHIDDLVSVYINAIENQKYEGIINAVSPERTTFNHILEIIENVKHPFLKIHIPRFILKLIFKDFANEICESLDAQPDKLIKNRFKFKYTHIKTAILDSLN